jgi:molybdate transport system regulatory protein
MIKNKMSRPRVKLEPCAKFWFEKGGEYAFGGGIAQILSAIRKTGSIKDASILLKESYRYVWGRIQKAERVMGLKLIETTVGGQDRKRTQLTEFAEKIINPYLKFESTTRHQINRAFKKMMKEINSSYGS